MCWTQKFVLNTKICIQHKNMYWTKICIKHKSMCWTTKYVLNTKIVFQFTPRHMSRTFLIRRRNQTYIVIKVKWSYHMPGVAQRVGRGIAVLFRDRGTGRGWVVSGTPRPHFTSGKDPVPIVQEAGWAPGPVWTGGKSHPYRGSIPGRPAHSSVAIPTELPGPPFIIINVT
jgi:hypothetical protein